MALSEALHRRTFLKNAGLTALFSAVSGSAGPAAAAAAFGGPDLVNGRYDFDTIYSRIGTDCTKWDQQLKVFGKDNIAVGMGIADMDFRQAPCITKALVDRLQHENFGYMTTPASHVDAMVSWNKRRYGLEIEPSWVAHAAGVHPAIISTLRAFQPPGTRVLLLTPTYNGFYSDISCVGCKPEESPMKLVDGRYSI